MFVRTSTGTGDYPVWQIKHQALPHHSLLIMKNTKPMKKIILSVTGILLLTAVLSLTIISCNKEEIEKNNTELNTPTPSFSEVDFHPYYEAAEKLARQFWAACDQAYQQNPEAFMQACKENNFAAFQQVTQLDPGFFEHFQSVLLQAQLDIESAHPGISQQYRESPCNECAEIRACLRSVHLQNTVCSILILYVFLNSAVTGTLQNIHSIVVAFIRRAHFDYKESAEQKRQRNSEEQNCGTSVFAFDQFSHFQ